MSLFDSYSDPDISGIFTNVIDNSIVTDSVEPKRTVLVLGPSKFGSVELMKFNDTETLKNVLGEENTFRYGLAQFYAKSFIKAGASVVFKRIEDPTATYANNLIYRNPDYYDNADFTKDPFKGAYFSSVTSKDTLTTALPAVHQDYNIVNETIKGETVFSQLATGKGNGYNSLFTTFTNASDYEKFEADDDGIENYKFNFLYSTVYENDTTVKKKSQAILCSLIDVDPEKGNVISHRSSGANLFINNIFEKQNLYLSARINTKFQNEMRKYPNLDAVLVDKNKPFLYIEATETQSDSLLSANERIWYEVEVNDSVVPSQFRIQRAVFSTTKDKRSKDITALPIFEVDGEKYILSIDNLNGQLSIRQTKFTTTNEATYKAGDVAYINGDNAFYTLKLQKDSNNQKLEVVTEKFRFLRWELYTYLLKYNIMLNGGKDSQSANSFVNLDGSANIDAIANQIYIYLRDDNEIKEVLYPKYVFNYCIDWTQSVKVKDILFLLADRVKRTMHICACPSVRLTASGISKDYSKDNDIICREQYLTRSSYNTMLYTSQNNKEHYDDDTKLTHRIPSDFYALLAHLSIDNDINYGITEPVGNINKGVLITSNLELSNKLTSPEIAELNKNQINSIITDGTLNYFLSQMTAYKKKSKLSLGNVVKTIQYLQTVIPTRLKPFLQKKEIDSTLTGALEELQTIIKPFKTSQNSKDAIFKDVTIKHSFSNEVLQLLLRITPVGTTQKIEVPIVVEG